MIFEELAPLKVNLFLHITDRRADGYHLLQSLFVFADFGDRIFYEATDAPLSLVINGPFAGQLPVAADNLMLRAANLLAAAPTGRLILNKQVPVASGLGGGSADAAATLRLLNRVWRLGHDETRLRQMAATLGADVPACVASRPVYVGGIGEQLTDAGSSESIPALIANPGIGMSTPKVFGAYRDAATAFTAAFPGWPFFDQPLARCGNDLTQAAVSLTPEINVCLHELGSIFSPDLVRMSGSGASCFALYDTPGMARDAARTLQTRHPAWWTRPVQLTVPRAQLVP